MNKLGQAVIALVLVIVSIFAIWQWNSKKQLGYDKSNLIRFHVIANSDSALDQALKYRVRDEVIRVMSPYFAGVEDISRARRVVSNHAGDISAAARKVISEAGYNYPVTVCMGHYQFPVKTYRLDDRENTGPPREITLPAGEYEAVRVIIGSGRGANWWCVLFPPLCFVSPVNVTATTAERTGSDRIRPAVEPAENNPVSSRNDDQITAGKEPVLPVPTTNTTDPSGDETVCEPPGESLGWERSGVEYRFKVMEWFKISRDWLKEFIN